MAEYKLANGGIVTDEDVEHECAEYEAGAWGGRLERIRVGRPTSSDEPLVPVVVKFPASMVAAMDAKGGSRSDFIRQAVANRLVTAS